MNYSLITEQQFQKRVYNLPENLKNALNSESVMGTVGHICQSHYFDNEKTLIIEQLTALVLSGFVAIEDMSKEIAENLEINKQLADSIYQEIDKKILTSLKDEIKKIYSPLVIPKSALSWGATKIELKPAIKEDVVDLKTKTVTGVSSEAIEITSKAISKEAVVLKALELKPEIKKEEPTIFGKVEPKTSSITLERPLGEEAPMMLHKETELTPLGAEKKSLAEAFTFSSGQEPTAKKESANLAVKISMGSETEEKKKDKIQMEKPSIRVVHYSDLNTSAPTFGKQAEPVISQSKEINIGFESKVVNRGGDGKTAQQKEPFDVTQGKFEKIFSGPLKPQTSEIKQEEAKISISPVEQTSLKIDDGEKLDPLSFKTSGLSVREAAERKALEEAKKAPPKIEQKPTPKPLNELQLKDIPVEEDVIDLRKIIE